MITLKIKHTKVTEHNLVPLVTGNVDSISVCFEFSDEWAELTKTAVFRNGGAKVFVALTEDECTIPSEVLASKGKLFVSVRGIGTDDFVLCTEDAYIGFVTQSGAGSSASASGSSSQNVVNPITFTANGTYTAPAGLDGYSPVTVNVPTIIDPLPYTNVCPKFADRYPSANPVIFCQMVSNFNGIFQLAVNRTMPYSSITLKSDLSVTNLSSVASVSTTAYGYTSPNFKTLTLDFPSLASCETYARMVDCCTHFAELRGTPLDFTSVSSANNSRWIRTINDSLYLQGVKAAYKPNTLHVNHNLTPVGFTDDTLVSIANGLRAGAYTITLHADMKIRAQAIMGTIASVTESGVTYDLFTADASGSTSLQSFITQTKGWTIA